MSAVLALRAEHKERFRARHGVGLGLMSFFARATIAALDEIRVGAFADAAGRIHRQGDDS